MIYFSTLLFSMFLTIILIPILKGLAFRMKVVDVPNQRKIHTSPMPKTGGIAIAMGVFVPLLLWASGNEFVSAVLFGAGVIVLFGFIDDIKELGYKAKFAGQLIAALIVIFYGGVKIESLGMMLGHKILLPVVFSIPFTLVAIMGVTNAINLSDGLDGLAGGISLLSFICIGYLAYLVGDVSVALISIAISGAIFGFLRFNTYPANVFMGDAGSQLIGFMAAILSLSLTQTNQSMSPFLPLFLVGLPVIDTITVILERILKERPLFVADKNHLHHKLMNLGLYHTESVVFIYFIQACLVTFAFVFRSSSDSFLVIFYFIVSSVMVAGSILIEKKGVKIKRYDFFDKVIKRRLRILKEKNIFIKVSFRIVEIGAYFILLFTCFIPVAIPSNYSICSMALLVLNLLMIFIDRSWMKTVMVVSLYLLIPFVVYLSDKSMVEWMNDDLAGLYNLSFGFLVFFAVLTLKFTRRQNGFKSTPMDFLILFIALVVPNLPDQRIQSYQLGLIAAKIIVLYFTYEVLIGELRVNLNRLGFTIISALTIVSIRGLIG